MRSAQPDLFALSEPAAVVDPELLERLRRELAALLSVAKAAERMPWDPTGAMLAELRFESLSSRLPVAERDALRGGFATELDRLYAAEAAIGD